MAEYLLQGAGIGTWVWNVQTGETRDGMIEITGGLKLGDQVVSVGQNKLRNGQTVAVDNRVAPPQAVDLP
jgi:membrane fusion protein (multidrug efflux system)